ncbi:unnamed protein product [Merluccius merluccius]
MSFSTFTFIQRCRYHTTTTSRAPPYNSQSQPRERLTPPCRSCCGCQHDSAHCRAVPKTKQVASLANRSGRFPRTREGVQGERRGGAYVFMYSESR